MLILVINCGSSSAKYELFEVEKEHAVCKGIVERIQYDLTLLRIVRNERITSRDFLESSWRSPLHAGHCSPEITVLLFHDLSLEDLGPGGLGRGPGGG